MLPTKEKIALPSPTVKLFAGISTVGSVKLVKGYVLGSAPLFIFCSTPFTNSLHTPPDLVKEICVHLFNTDACSTLQLQTPAR